MDYLTMGVTPPKTVDELIWYVFGLLALYFLWSINKRLGTMEDKIEKEGKERSDLALKVAAIEARCVIHRENHHV